MESLTDSRLKIYIKSAMKVYSVVAVGEATLEQEEFCSSRFVFTAMKDDVICFNQGDAVSVKIDGEGLFCGYVFSKSRDKKGLIEVVCYDQMRYMKNKRSYTRGRLTVEEALRKITDEYGFAAGEWDSCKVMLPPVAAENVSLIDVVKRACRQARSLTGERFVFYDDCGRLVLRNEAGMKTGIMIDTSQIENFEYTDTIDEKVYNTVEIYSEERRSATRRIVRVKDDKNVAAWGSLILSKRAEMPENAAVEGTNLLREYNRVNREFVLKRAGGNRGFVPGGSVYVRLVAGDVVLNGYVRIRKAVHRFCKNNYETDIYLDGSEIG